MIGRKILRRGALAASLVVALVAVVIAVRDGVAVTDTARRPARLARDPERALRHTIDAPIPATLFGMHTMGLVDRLPIPIGAQAKSTATAWPYIETARGTFDWSGEDAAVAAATTNRTAPPFYSTDGIPSWATTDTKTCIRNFAEGALLCSAMMKNIADWDAFITALVTRYRGKMIYELWNEPNTIYFSGSVDDMVTIANRESDIIRRIDPTAIIIAPSGDARYMDRFFAAGGTRDVDVVSFHEYNSTPEDVVETINSMRAVMAKYGLSEKALWETEGGWAQIPHVKGKVDDYPGFVARRYLLEWSLGIGRFYWYAWNNALWGTLSNTDNLPNSAGVAYKETFEWMRGATMTSPCTQKGSVWKCGLARPGGYEALAVWDADGNSPFAPPEIYRQYKELDGNTKSFTPGSSVTIGFRPLLFEIRPVDK